jgi:2-polyprenyl-3-methyl-5-hydroxy-6-metoxy-1,4-benzoquinol methylase
MKDVIDDGKTGFLVPIRSPHAVDAAVDHLLSSPSLRREMGTAARKAAVQQYHLGQRRAASTARLRGAAVSGVSRLAYDTWHDLHDVDRDVDTPWHRLLFAHLDGPRDLAGRRVLEIACGRGGLACRLARHTHRPGHLVAADFSTTAVAKGRSHARAVGLPGLQWSVSDLHACGIQSGTFDTVISCESIEHLERPRQACVELARMLKPGGRLYLTTPNYLGPLGLYRGYARLKGTPYTEVDNPSTFSCCCRVRAPGFGEPAFAFERWTPSGITCRGPAVRCRAFPGWTRGGPLRWFALHSLVVAEKP